MRAVIMLAFAAGAFGWLPPAAAKSDVIGVEAFDGQVDIRISTVGGERGWLDGGFGKLREGGDANRDAQPRLRVAAVDLAWKPQFSWGVSGLVSVTKQDSQSPDVDINEAFLKFRSGPGKVRVSARAGIFWPPISQEHGGSTWQVEDSITPSAVNSWVGEEVKVLGLETTLKSEIGEQELGLTGAVFLHNDMAGTLLSYRGWALHDVRATVRSDLPLPPLSPPIARYQDTITSPFWEVDDKIGYYARVDWRMSTLPIDINLFRYDNRGDRLSSRDMQTSWRTRFWNVGLIATLGERTTAKTQLLWGNTLVGPNTPAGIPVDVDFIAGYVLISREIGKGKVTLRGDWFKTDDRGMPNSDNNNEHGWAAMAAFKRPVHKYADAIVEVLHVDSNRPARRLNAGIDSRQAQTIVQTSLRLGF